MRSKEIAALWRFRRRCVAGGIALAAAGMTYPADRVLGGVLPPAARAAAAETGPALAAAGLALYLAGRRVPIPRPAALYLPPRVVTPRTPP